MAKHLSIADINKQHQAKFNEMKRINLSNGSYCDINKHFRPTKIQQLISDYQDVLRQISNKIESEDVGKNVLFVFYMLLLRHFTSLGDKIPLNIEKMVVLCEKMIDLGILDELLNAFPQEEINKVSEIIQKVNQNTKLIENQIGELLTDAELAKDENDV